MLQWGFRSHGQKYSSNAISSFSALLPSFHKRNLSAVSIICVKLVFCLFKTRIALFFGYCVQCESGETLKKTEGLDHTRVGNFHVRLLMIVPQVTDPFESNFITLNDLKPLRVYCFQVQAKLILTKENISRPGHLSNISCSKTASDGNVCFPKCFLSELGTEHS